MIRSINATLKPSAEQTNKNDWPDGYRIVIVAPFPPPFGGMGIQAEQLYTLLDSNDIPVSKIYSNWKITGKLKFIENISGIRTLIHLIHFLKKVVAISSSKTIFHVFSNSFASFFLWTGTCFIVCKLRGAPIIVNYRGGYAEQFLHYYRTIALLILGNADKVIVPSRYLESIFAKYQISTQIVPNIISDSLKPDKKMSVDFPQIIINRNFEPIYNVESGLYAFAKIQINFPDAKLILIGDGSLRQKLETKVKDLYLQNVVFTGQLQNHKVIQLLQSSDVMINPTNVDNMPISILEAMAVGLPIVSTNVGGVPFLLENEVDGILVAKNDHNALADATISILKSKELQTKLCDNASKKVEMYRWHNIQPLWVSHYLSLIK